MVDKNHSKLLRLLNEKVQKYNAPAFIVNDPICIPHQFTVLQDIEIMGFWTAMLAWGQRKTIINKSNELVLLMEGHPYEFMLHHTAKDLKRFMDFVHRTFQFTDTQYFIYFFSQYYKNHYSLEEAFLFDGSDREKNVEKMLIHFHNAFFQSELAPHRTKKHVPTPASGSTCKRLNMFLRWMVRKDNSGVDFGVWDHIRPDQLICPVDVHVDTVARNLGLITRKQTDWKTALELTEALKEFDAADPVRYDFALFTMGVDAKMA